VAEPVFLTLDEVLFIHADQIRRHGGRPGVRELGLLSSALAMPAASLGGMRLHTSLGEMAAAYLFHFAKNHPFIDGNKRAALASALAFLWLNDRRLEANDDDLTDLVIGVAAGRVSKAEAAVFLAAHLRPVRSR
jgi:death-on-curing protein